MILTPLLRALSVLAEKTAGRLDTLESAYKEQIIDKSELEVLRSRVATLEAGYALLNQQVATLLDQFDRPKRKGLPPAG
jgi:Tfp pilus assembly protein PilO